MKKSFILYVDQGEIINSLTDAQAGKIIKAIFDFENGKEVQLSTVLNSVFISFRQTLVRDDAKWRNIVERNKKNGAKGGRPKNPKEPKKPSGLLGNPKNLDSVNDNDIYIRTNSNKENITSLLQEFQKNPKYARFDMPQEFKNMRNNYKAKGITIKDYRAGLELWLEKALTFGKGKQEQTIGDNERMKKILDERTA